MGAVGTFLAGTVPFAGEHVVGAFPGRADGSARGASQLNGLRRLPLGVDGHGESVAGVCGVRWLVAAGSGAATSLAVVTCLKELKAGVSGNICSESLLAAVRGLPVLAAGKGCGMGPIIVFRVLSANGCGQANPLAVLHGVRILVCAAVSGETDESALLDGIRGLEVETRGVGKLCAERLVRLVWGRAVAVAFQEGEAARPVVFQDVFDRDPGESGPVIVFQGVL